MSELDAIDPGNTITLIAPFLRDPDEVNFAYMQPGQSKPFVDAGWAGGKPKKGSRIVRLDEGIYQYVIDTTGFRGGEGSWHFWGKGGGVTASRYGKFCIHETLPQLL